MRSTKDRRQRLWLWVPELAAALVVAGLGASQAAAAPPSDFDKTLIVDGLDTPTAFRFVPDGPTLDVRPEEWSAFAAWMLDNGLLEEPVDAERVVTDRFLPEEPA